MTFPPLFPSSMLISTPVCHHRDHCHLRVGRVPQVLEETQAALHPGLLRLLLHPGISHDHRGTDTDARHTPLQATPMPRGSKYLPQRYSATLSLSKVTDSCLQSEVVAPGGQGSVSGTRWWVLLKSRQLQRAKSRMKQDASISFLMISRYKLV